MPKALTSFFIGAHGHDTMQQHWLTQWRCKVCAEHMLRFVQELWKQLSIGWQISRLLLVVAMTDLEVGCTREAVTRYNMRELQTAYYTHYGKLPRKDMSKDELLVSEVLGTNAVLG